MERGIRASDEGRKKAANSLKLKGWTQEYLAGASQCTRQTVNRFLAGKAIEKRIFQTICAQLCLDWGSIADLPVGERPKQHPTLNDLVETIHISLYDAIREWYGSMQVLEMSQKIDLNPIYTPVSERFAPWRLEINQYIRHQTPFQLTYRDTAGRPWSFTIRYARIISYERRQYLECWCEEIEGNQDLPELQHNWTLRLDCIPDAALGTVRGRWRPDLDHLDVEMHLLKGLAFAYEPKTADISNEWLSDCNPPVRRIIRRISNTFWFFREVFRYGADCIIVTPESVKGRFRQKLHALHEVHGLAER